MAYKTLNLTSTTVKGLKPEGKMYRIKDSRTRGLHIEVATSGSKFWRYKYTFHTQKKTMTLGKYPNVSLAQARADAYNHLNVLYNGTDPKQKSIQVSQSKTTFEEAFKEWHKHKSNLSGDSRWSNHFSVSVLQRAKKHLFPKIGKLPVVSIDVRDLSLVFNSIEDKGKLDTLHKLSSYVNRTFKRCIKKHIINTNPMRNLDTSEYDRNKVKNYATITSPKEVGKLLRTIENKCNGGWQVKKALELAPLLLLRPGTLVWLERNEINFEERKIYIPGHKMKTGKEHIVPMSSQAMEIFAELICIDTGSDFIFPSPNKNKKYINPNSLLQSMRRVGITKERFVTHGFRAMASTILNEHGHRSDAIELQLAHVERNRVKKSYNHAELLNERAEIMQWYSDYILELKSNATGYIC
jgi:integrase